MMRDGRCHGDQAAANDHRREQHNVGRVRTARERIIADDDVTSPPTTDRDRLCDVAKGGGHDAKLRRDSGGLGDQLTFAVQKPAGIIDHVPDDGRIGRAAQGRGHFLGDRGNLMLKDIAVDGRQSHARPSKTNSAPSSKTCRNWPGNTTVVLSFWEMRSGPFSL